MATTHYESVVIINAALEDPQIEQAIASIQTNIKSTGGEITETEDWGRKRLAYNINNAKSGYYLITRFVGPPAMIKEFERTLKLDENVIRYITIALDKKALEYLKKVKKAQSEEKISETEPVVEEKP
jgi:small subunit ribosomal protein S6